MLIQISIENLALIKEVSLSLGPGLNVVTGETGAGKSIVVDAMNLLVGGRASAELVRTGADKAWVEGVFDCSSSPRVSHKLAELGLPVSEDATLLLAREVVPGGRSICRINGRAVPLAMYRAIGELLVDLHGQHEHQSLLQVEQHRELLDRYGGPAILQQRAIVENLYRRFVHLKRELEQQNLDEQQTARRLDSIRYAITEIDRLQPLPGEEIELERERERLRHGEKLAELAGVITSELSGGDARIIPAYDLLSRAAEKAREMVRFDTTAELISGTLEEIRYKLEDVLEQLRDYREKLDFDPGHAQEVEDRLHALRGLMHKYGKTLQDVCAYRDQCAAELDDLSEGRLRTRELAAEYGEVLDQYEAAAGKLSELRRDKAAAFVSAVTGELQGLGMGSARFEIAWERLSEPTVTGRDHLEFMFSANPGEPVKPLAKIASGGEMSRMMLALKVILAESDQIPTLIFDEIDTGIGGRTLQVVGERLGAVAANKQVLCVTHSPHIAGRGMKHFYIDKRVTGGQTLTYVQQLEEEERVSELVRMLGGTEGEEVIRSHAVQILRVSRGSLDTLP